MINEFYKKIDNFKNDDNILSDDINKKTRILNNTSKGYNNLLDTDTKMNILKSINSITKSGILMI